MLKHRIYFFIILTFILLYPVSHGFSDSRKVPWSLRHFPTAPRITAEQSMQLKLSGQKIIVIDVPWSKGDYEKGHICGAVRSGVEAEKLDRLIKKIPKDYIILAY